MKRDFEDMDLVAVFLDGKKFEDIGCLIVRGIDALGKKRILGIDESTTEKPFYWAIKDARAIA